MRGPGIVCSCHYTFLTLTFFIIILSGIETNLVLATSSDGSNHGDIDSSTQDVDHPKKMDVQTEKSDKILEHDNDLSNDAYDDLSEENNPGFKFEDQSLKHPSRSKDTQDDDPMNKDVASTLSEETVKENFASDHFLKYNEVVDDTVRDKVAKGVEHDISSLNEGHQEEDSQKDVVYPDESHSTKEKTNNNEAKEDLISEIEEEDVPDTTVKQERQKYFRLLSSFQKLFRSFLSDFGDVSNNNENENINNNNNDHDVENRFNSSDNGTSSLNEILNDSNSNVTSNNSDSAKKTRFQCALRNVTEDMFFEVKIVNSTELLDILNSSKNLKQSPCVLVMFYAPWCYFCAKTAPHYNAVARAFPQLQILAVDTSHFSYLNARFGTVAVPNVMLFHSRSAVRFNHTTRDLGHFVQFITNNTGLEPNANITVESFDYVGPLSSVVEHKPDWLLWVAWAFVIVCSTYGFVQSLHGQAFIAKVRLLWQEHQHIE